MKSLVCGLAICASALMATSPVYAEKPLYNRPESAIVSLSENKGAYQVILGDKQLDEVDVYVNATGAFIPLDSLLSKLGYSLYRDDANQIAQITFADASTLTLNFEKGEYTRRGSTGSLQGTDYILIGPYFFLNTSFMNKVFPIGISLDQAARKLRIRQTETLAAQTAQANRKPEKLPALQEPLQFLSRVPLPATDDYPVPEPAPRMPVVVDDFMQPQPHEAPKVDAPGQDVIRTLEPAKHPPPLPVPSVAAPFAPLPPVPAEIIGVAGNAEEDNTLILQPRIKRAPPSDQFIEAWESNGTLYLPLDDMMQLLEFDIKTDPVAGTAEGSYMTPPQAFSLHLDKGEVQVNRRSQTLVKGEAIRQDNRLYVSAAAFEKWFGVSAILVRQTMVLKLDSKTALPLEARLQRHALWDKLLATNSSAKNSDAFVKIQNPYRFASWPSVNVDLTSAYSRGGQQGNKGVDGSYAILTGGDLGYMTTNFFATGTRNKSVSNLRLTAGRKDPDGTLFGPLRATSFSIGDIEAPTLANVASDPNGRGVFVSNRALDAASGFDTHTFSGNAVPGWEVELYQNKTLLAFQSVGSDGRYTFLDVPLLYGNNDFRIVLYGPQGQAEERTETILVGSSMLKKGSFEYTIAASQKGMGTLDNLYAPTASLTASPGVRAISELRYGVSKYLTAGAGFAQTTILQTTGENVEHRYATASLDAALGGAFINAAAARDLNGGWVGGVTGLTSIEDISIRARHRRFNNYISETEPASNQHKSDSELAANGQFYLPLIRDFNLGVKAKYEVFTEQAAKKTYSTTFAKSFWGTNFSNTLDYIMSTDTQALGTAGWQGRFRNVLLRADARYEIKPTMQFQEAAMTMQYRLGKRMTAQTKIDKQLSAVKTITLSQSVNWDFSTCRLSLSGDVNDSHETHVGLSLVFAFAHDPLQGRWRMQRQGAADSGSIATRIFEDDAFDGVYNESKKIIATARPRVNNLPLSDASMDGTFISPVSPYVPLDVSVDPASLKDPMLSPGSAGYRVLTRPGDVVLIDLPVVSTSEIDGEIAITDDSGVRKTLPDIVVELIDQNGKVIKRVISESDGYFIFQKIRPGTYTLSVPAEALAEYDAVLAATLPIKVGKSSDFYSGNNLVLHTKVYKTGKRTKSYRSR